jgi:hypothetical protein
MMKLASQIIFSLLLPHAEGLRLHNCPVQAKSAMFRAMYGEDSLPGEFRRVNNDFWPSRNLE